ncbi:hypothetical protein BX666DRAFT_1878493 [Dichotomocladium elegans]|nr:hypothetical protein BX666DRAFT_1878493 [Dichotomocladium elegans]
MAVVDSLSRDLASEAKDEGAAEQQRKQDPQSALRLTALLILPFLHIPHALITTIFDSLTTSDSNNFAGVLAWGLFFALANVMINKVIRPKTLTAFVTTRSVAVGPFPWATTPPPATTAAATASDAMRQSPPGSNLNHHHPTLYRRRRVIRRPSVYRTKPTIPLSPTSAGLIRSRTQPGESLKQQQLLPSVPQQQFRPVVKRRNSF